MFSCEICVIFKNTFKQVEHVALISLCKGYQKNYELATDILVLFTEKFTFLPSA